VKSEDFYGSEDLFFLFRGRRVANPLGSSAQVCSQLRSFLMNSLFSDLITVPLVFSIFNSFYSFESLSTFFLHFRPFASESQLFSFIQAEKQTCLVDLCVIHHLFEKAGAFSFRNTEKNIDRLNTAENGLSTVYLWVLLLVESAYAPCCLIKALINEAEYECTIPCSTLAVSCR